MPYTQLIKVYNSSLLLQAAAESVNKIQQNAVDLDTIDTSIWLASLQAVNPKIYTVSIGQNGQLFVEAATYDSNGNILTDLTETEYQQAIAAIS